MAHPKHKISKSRRDKRRTHKKLRTVNLGLCPQCHEPKLPHHVCLSCGTYKGQEILAVEKT
ncbi:MAG TPA: 50S ribosomal protein L32 [Nitrospiria bacterium]|nr:50S ribosomal protein L32 [Nitrospiria bacterium]